MLDDNFTIQNKWTTKRHDNLANNEESPASMPFSIRMCEQIHILHCVHYVMHGSIYNGENLIYKNQGHNAVIKIIDSWLNKDGMLDYTIEFEIGVR